MKYAMSGRTSIQLCQNYPGTIIYSVDRVWGQKIHHIMGIFSAAKNYLMPSSYVVIDM